MTSHYILYPILSRVADNQPRFFCFIGILLAFLEPDGIIRQRDC